MSEKRTALLMVKQRTQKTPQMLHLAVNSKTWLKIPSSCPATKQDLIPRWSEHS